MMTEKTEGLPEERVIALLREKGLLFSSAESCTGGLLMATLVNVPGASEVIKEGFITYANEAKEKHLGVRKETLERYGAVSEQTAGEMAEGLYERTDADVTAAVTGIAGPGGGTPDKPVGTVYIACCCMGKLSVERLQLSGSRKEIREESVRRTLLLVERCLLCESGKKFKITI